MKVLPGVRYYDVRQVTGQVTHIDIDNGVVESAGTSFFNKAVVRVLGQKGWGILQVDNYSPGSQKKFAEMLLSAGKLARITEEPVLLGDAPRQMLSVPSAHEDCRSVGIEEKSAILSEIEGAARHPQVVNRRANYIERVEQVRFFDSSDSEYSFEICRSGFSVLAVASREGNVQMGYERDHSIHGFNLRHRQELGKKAAEIAVALLDAGAPKGGKMHAVLDPNSPACLPTKQWGTRAKGISSRKEIRS